jgi:GT2 family glycosyltransferase
VKKDVKIFMSDYLISKIGVVLIGRNEGERLICCFKSLQAQLHQGVTVIYVDSGSTDGSCEAARERRIDVVELDMSIPFTASRARNAGFERLRHKVPQVEYVQFIDGDCELVEGWIIAAADTFDREPDVVAVCGWTRERFPEQTMYNRISDVEWHQGSVGPILHFAGNVMIRAEAFAEVGGYDNNVIAAEDDELSVRLRQAGGKLLRIDKKSVIHDIDMHTVFQWWQRAKRTGHAYAQVSYLHGAPPERKFFREIRGILLWGVILPISALALAPLTYGLSLIAFVRYPLTTLRIFYKTRRQGFSRKHSLAWGLSCTMSVFPGVIGASKFHLDRLHHRQHEIIEHKRSQTPVTKE